MTTKAELEALAEALTAEAIDLLVTSINLQADVKDLGKNVAALERAISNLDEPTTPPDPPPVGVEPAAEIQTLVAGPYLERGDVYTGQQMGHLYRDRDWNPMRSDWPNYTRPQGQYRDGWCGINAVEPDMMRLTLTRDGHPDYSATTLMEQHLIFDETEPDDGVKRAVYECEFKRVTGEQFKTIKLGGLVGFDGNWQQWPGGGSHGRANFSVRAVLNDTWGVGPRLSAYLYLGKAGQASDLVIWGMDTATFWSNQDHTVEITPRDGPVIEAGVSYQLRIEADAGHPGAADGSLRMLLRVVRPGPWELVLRVDNIMWALQGRGVWNRGYPMVMYGGRDESFAPQNPEQTGVIDLGRIRFAELE